jgi:aspartate racemase
MNDSDPNQETARHIGIVACSVEGAALCYRSIAIEAAPLMGEHDHPRVSISSIPMARHMEYIRRDDWRGVADLLLEGAREVASAGAEFAICPDNTCHQAFPDLQPRSPIPFLHIAEVVADEAERQGLRRLGILGTKYLMEGPVYRDVLARRSIEMRIPPASERERINEFIFRELVKGIFLESTREIFYAEITQFQALGCDAAVLGCTEIPLIVVPEEVSLPTLDSTRLLARAALRRSVGGQP